jgi:hypothetical protein
MAHCYVVLVGSRRVVRVDTGVDLIHANGAAEASATTTRPFRYKIVIVEVTVIVAEGRLSSGTSGAQG